MRSIILLLPLSLLGCGQSFKQSPYDLEDSGFAGAGDRGETDSAVEEDAADDEQDDEDTGGGSGGSSGGGGGEDGSGDDGGDGPAPVEEMTFVKVPIFELPGVSWLQAVDLDLDGVDEYLATSMTEGVGDWPSFIGAGAAYILSRDPGTASPGNPGTWTSTLVFDRSSEIDWPNDSSFFDVNNDGIKDWVIGRGFIPLPDGGIIWLPGYESGGTIGFDAPETISTPWTDRFYHKAHPVDMDGDGDMDFVTTNRMNAETDWRGNELAPGESKLEWYENEGISGTASFTHHAIADRGGALMVMHDVDEDGDQDVILPQYFDGSALIWMENPGNTSSTWTEHVINDNTGRGFDVVVADMNHDGRMDLVYGNHNHQDSSEPFEDVMGIYWFEIPAAGDLDSLSNWDAYMNVIFEGFYVDDTDVDQSGAPGVFQAGDVNQDGLMDVSVSGDGDDGLYAFVQEADGSFLEVLVDSGTVMGGEHLMADFDGDGRMDYLWTIYGEMDLLRGQIAPQSELNIYLQDVVLVDPDAETYRGAIDFEITTSFGPDSCTGTIELSVIADQIEGDYQCGFSVIGSQNHAVRGSIDSAGNITGSLDLTTTFSSDVYSIDWTGTYDGSQITADTTGSSTLGTMDIDYTVRFTAL